MGPTNLNRNRIGYIPWAKQLGNISQVLFSHKVQAAQPLLHDIIVPGTSLLWKQEYKMFIDI